MEASEMMNRILSESCVRFIEKHENGEEWHHFTVRVHCVEFDVVARAIIRKYQPIDYTEYEIRRMGSAN